MVIEAVRQNGKVLYCASKELQNDEELKKLYEEYEQNMLYEELESEVYEEYCDHLPF